MHDYDKPLDYHNTVELRSLLDKYNVVIDKLNEKIGELNKIEREIRILLAKNDSKLKETLSYQQKMIKLISIDPTNESIVNIYHDVSTEIKVLTHQKSLIEEQIKCEKKIFDSTPK